MKRTRLNALLDLEDDLAATARLVTAAYMAAADLQDEAVDPMRTLLDLIVDRLNATKAALAEMRGKKTPRG